MVTFAERVGDVFEEVLKVAVSPGLTGAFLDDQFAPEFQLAEPGSSSHVASTPCAAAVENKSEKKRANDDE